MIILRNDIGMMGYVNAEKTGVMDLAVLMMVKCQYENREQKCS